MRSKNPMAFKILQFIFLTCCLFSVSLARQSVTRKPIALDDLAIEVKGESRGVSFTNKNAGVLFTETSAEHRNGWQGWRVYAKEMLEDYRIIIGGYPLLRKEVTRTVVTPDHMKRYYANGIEETITLLDSLNALVVEVDNVKMPEVAVYPLFSDAGSEDDFELDFNKDILTIVHKNHEVRTEKENYPASISVSWVRENLWTGGFYDSTDFGKNFSPAYTKTVNPVAKHFAVFTVGDSAYDSITLMKFVAKNVDSLLNVRKKRMARVLNDSYLETNDPRLNKALGWAKISMDNLIMNQGRKGIFAGLPWFDNYWGRDTYISLPGATLVTGNFSAAREILRTFAAAQDTNPSATSYGRVPNIITTTSTAYNTADGTPWFTIALGEYFNYTNDKSLVLELYPAVRRGIEGTLKHHTDAQMFLTHGDAETWMDAAGPDGAWSPRGNRANDIQGLWYRQLEEGSRLAAVAGDDAHATAWKATAATLQENFRRSFVDNTSHTQADHLTKEGAGNRQLRPNQIFTAGILGDEGLTREMFSTVTQSLVFPHGVASLSQDDENFHPYHRYPPFYVQDAAYHNGVVWSWLSGTWIDLATRFGRADLAFILTNNMADQILDRGTVGTLSELVEAAPRQGEALPRLSGTYSQAWSLAEFIRPVYQDYLGVTMGVEDGKPLLILCPNLPKEITAATAKINIGKRSVLLEYAVTGSEVSMTATPDSSDREPLAYRIDLVRGSKRIQAMKGTIAPYSPTLLRISKNTISELSGGKTKTETVSGVPETVTDEALSAVHLATPVVREGLASLKGPSYQILTIQEIKAPAGGRILLNVSDPENDDKGPGKYTYPGTSMLKPGSLDITRLTVSADERNTHFILQFRELSNPGWHPEYGFQLTYAAIAIDKDGKDASGQATVGRNAKYTFGKGFRFENIIYVGGGISIADAKGATIAEYLPVEADAANPLGDDRTKTIEFSIPNTLLGSPSPSWRYAVLVGAQDDHGGAGIGEFRSVEAVQSEWSGGGKKKSGDSNVYDVILPKR